ncbi:MAG: hypothetical protein FWB76_07435 [Oscillospiraceae bacterium]|nr:hypothetical protein [Oscillospiraceae bacterium]
MKHTKRLLALVLTIALAFGLAVPAVANNAQVVASPPTGNWLIDTFTGWADSIAQRLIDGLSPAQLSACGADDSTCIIRVVWRNVRSSVIWGGIIFAVAAVVLTVVIVIIVNHVNAA